MRIILCEESNQRDWEELVEGSEEATTGHLWQWREIVASAYGFKPFYLMAEEDGRPLAVAPFISVRSLLYGNELASMPYLDYGGVCHSSRLPEEARPEVDRAIFDDALKLALGLNAKRLHVRTPVAPRRSALRDQYGKGRAASGTGEDGRGTAQASARRAPQPAAPMRAVRLEDGDL